MDVVKRKKNKLRPCLGIYRGARGNNRLYLDSPKTKKPKPVQPYRKKEKRCLHRQKEKIFEWDVNLKFGRRGAISFLGEYRGKKKTWVPIWGPNCGQTPAKGREEREQVGRGQPRWRASERRNKGLRVEKKKNRNFQKNYGNPNEKRESSHGFVREALAKMEGHGKNKGNWY